MWDKIQLKKAIEKSYGMITRFGSTIYECVSMIALNHLKKINMTQQLKNDFIQQQQELLRIHSTISELNSSLSEESELANSLHLLHKDIISLAKQNEDVLQQIELLIQTEEANSSNIWKTLHGQRVLLIESIRILGKSLKKEEHIELAEQEKMADELMRDISTMINKK